jgi:hypothetical protein
MVMASLISNSAPLCSASTSTKSALYPLPSSSFIPYHKAPQFGLSTSIALPGLGPFSQWSGLKHLDISTPPRFIRKGIVFFFYLGLVHLGFKWVHLVLLTCFLVLILDEMWW